MAALTPADMRAQVLARLPALRMLDRSEVRQQGCLFVPAA
jgi:hypothetical protein